MADSKTIAITVTNGTGFPWLIVAVALAGVAVVGYVVVKG
jgi:hypothetical protein